MNARYVTAIPLGWLAAAFSIAELADLMTAIDVNHEYNPIAASLASTPLLALALKLGLIALVVATAVICDRQRPGLARFVLVVGVVAGLVGAISNTHLNPV